MLFEETVKGGEVFIAVAAQAVAGINGVSIADAVAATNFRRHKFDTESLDCEIRRFMTCVLYCHDDSED